jgi:hypothetical protein
VRFVESNKGKQVAASVKGNDENYDESESSEEDDKVEQKCEELLTVVDCRGVYYRGKEGC